MGRKLRSDCGWQRICYPIRGWLRNREDSILSSHTN
nr:MAG TPA: Ribosome, eukaryotic, ribosomal, 80S, RNA.0A [Caudoviricetes sp.]